MFTLINEFHGTEYRTRFSRDELSAILDRKWSGDATPAELATVRRIRRVLCGIEGCLCGTSEFHDRGTDWNA